MSRTFHPHAWRVLAAAGFLGLAGLIAPAATYAQTISPERALLNPTPVLSRGEVTHAREPAPTVDGERALLGRSTADIASRPALAADSLREARPVDGERALLGKVAQLEPRRLILAR